MKYLLDTNICIFFLRGKYGIPEKICSVGLENCCISEITRAELLVGMNILSLTGNPHRNEQLPAFLNAIRTIPITSSIDYYAAEKARLAKEGRLIDDFDLLIGCSAAVCGLILITDNTSHLSRIDGLQLDNWVIRDK